MGNCIKSKESYDVNAIKGPQVGSNVEGGEKEERFQEAFNRIASEDGEIDAYQLKDVLNNTVVKDYNCRTFSADLCRSMVATLDRDLSGKLGYDEAKALRDGLIKWKQSFDSLDKDGSGYLHDTEVDTALSLLGVKVGPRATKAIVARYSNKEGKISFVDFVSGMIRLNSMMETYETKDQNGESGEAQFFLDEFIQMTVYS